MASSVFSFNFFKNCDIRTIFVEVQGIVTSKAFTIIFKPMISANTPSRHGYVSYQSNTKIQLPSLAAYSKKEMQVPVVLDRNGLIYTTGDPYMRCVFEYKDIRDKILSSPEYGKVSVPFGTYEVPDTAPLLTATALGSLSFANFMALYDAFITAEPNYVSKQVIGTVASGAVELFSYRFKPKSADDTKQAKYAKMLKIPVICGMHGGSERPSYYGPYIFFHQLLNNWKSDPLLEFLRFNVEFVVIPRVNNTGARYNSNQVDINRNFYVNWVASDTSAGTAALSENETKAVYKMLVDELPTADFVLDVHNLITANPKVIKIFIGGEDGSSMGFDSMSEELRSIGDRIVRDSYLAFHKKYETYFGTDYSIVQDKTAIEPTAVIGGSVMQQIKGWGVPGYCLETARILNDITGAVEFDEYAQRLSAQVLGNAILAVARAFLT